MSEDGVREIRYRPDAFDFGPNRIDPAKLKGLGFAGFRLHYPINSPKVKDEVLAFLGASYFRALGRDQVYGVSARGLAINRAEASGEFRVSSSSGWCARRRTRRSLSFSACSTRRAWPVLIASTRASPNSQVREMVF